MKNWIEQRVEKKMSADLFDYTSKLKRMPKKNMLPGERQVEK